MSPTSNVALSERVMGQYNVSVPTSLALEYINGIHEEKPEKVPPARKYKVLAMNVETLVRNFLGSLDGVARITVTGESSIPFLYAEINTIESILKDSGIEFLLYKVNYDKLGSEFPKAVIKEPKTPNQKIERRIMDSLVKAIEESDLKLHYYKSYKQIGLGDRTFIVTHYPVDLLNVHKAVGPDLLESHTGTIKDRFQWGSKLGLGDAKDLIPFSSLAIQVFGDKSNHFSPMGLKLKRYVVEHAKENGWNKKTTKDRMRFTLKKIKEKELREFLLDLL